LYRSTLGSRVVKKKKKDDLKAKAMGAMADLPEGVVLYPLILNSEP